MDGFSKEHSERIGFMTSCLFHEALDISEMKQWILKILEEGEHTPNYLVELLDFEPPLADIFKTIGFVPHWRFPEDAKLALFGIAFNRGRLPYDCPLSRDQAIEKLGQYPEVEATFRSEFPFAAISG